MRSLQDLLGIELPILQAAAQARGCRPASSTFA
jgi:hypothetical protein